MPASLISNRDPGSVVYSLVAGCTTADGETTQYAITKNTGCKKRAKNSSHLNDHLPVLTCRCRAGLLVSLFWPIADPCNSRAIGFGDELTLSRSEYSEM